MIAVEDHETIRRITLNRPDKANSLTGELLDRLAEAVEGSTAAALVLTGTGRVFSAGADLDEVRAGTLATHPGWERLSSAIAAHPGLTVAALNGTCAGGALGMMLACDIRLSVASANFFYPVLKMGVLPQPSDPGRMSRLIGPARTALILMGAARVGADEALSWGLVDRIHDPETLTDEANALCAAACAAGPSRVAQIRAMVG